MRRAVLAAILTVATLSEAQMPDSYHELAALGIVSGFGYHSGDPSAMINSIPAIDRPHYVSVSGASLRDDDLRDDDLCAGIERQGVMHFAPLFILNSHEIVNHDDAPAIAYCPLAGLSVAIDGKAYISGLLRWDTFVLYREEDDALVLPFDQTSVGGDQHVPLHPLQQLTFAGIKVKYPEARVLSPRSHDGNRSAYGSYPTDRRLGIGHDKAGQRGRYDPGTESLHPKERVVLIGTAGRLMKAYPFSELAAATEDGAHTLTDEIDGRQVVLSYDPAYQHAQVQTSPSDSLQVRAFSFYFSLRQNLPDLPVFRHR